MTPALAEAWRIAPHTFAARASNGQWRIEPHLEYISKKILAALIKGNARLIINGPPRHGKSFLISYWLPVWFLNTWPERRVILAAYGEEIAVEWGRRVRNEFARNQFLSTPLRDDSKAASRWHTPQGGGMFATGVGGALSGYGGDLLLGDDLIKNWQDAHSQQCKSVLWDWWHSTFFTRKEPGASIVLAMTRWATDDICARLVKEQPGEWEVITLPALADENDPLGRKPGAALCPSRFDTAALLATQKDVGGAVWNALYQQQPDAYGAGRLYSHFDKLNVEEGIKFNPSLPLFAALDFNVSPGMHAVLMQYDPAADLFTCIDEVHASRMDVRSCCREIVRRAVLLSQQFGGHLHRPDVHVFGDATGKAEWAGTAESCYDLVRAELTSVRHMLRVPSVNPPVRVRIDTVQEALLDVQGKRHVKIHPRCERLLADFADLQADEFGLEDKKDHLLSHASSAFGYCCCYIRPLGTGVIKSGGRFAFGSGPQQHTKNPAAAFVFQR